jgi:hypothetical protein
VIVNFWLLPIAVVLLWFPRQWLRLGVKVIPLSPRHAPTDKDLRDARDISLRLRDELVKPRNWIDFSRAVTGSIGICFVCFDVQPDAPRNTGDLIFGIQCVVLLTAVAIQTIRFQHRLTLVAPVFFILGLSFGLLGWQAAVFACVTIWVLNLLIPSPGFFLMVFAALEVLFSRLLAGGVPAKLVLLAAVIATGPVIFSAMTNRRLVKLNRKKRNKPLGT